MVVVVVLPYALINVHQLFPSRAFAKWWCVCVRVCVHVCLCLSVSASLFVCLASVSVCVVYTSMSN